MLPLGKEVPKPPGRAELSWGTATDTTFWLSYNKHCPIPSPGMGSLHQLPCETFRNTLGILGLVECHPECCSLPHLRQSVKVLQLMAQHYSLYDIGSKDLSKAFRHSDV